MYLTTVVETLVDTAHNMRWKPHPHRRLAGWLELIDPARWDFPPGMNVGVPSHPGEKGADP